MMYFTDYREMNNFSLDERNSVAAKINFQLTPYLYRIGLSPHIAGYFYLRDAVAEYLLAPGASFSVTKDIYPRIAEKYTRLLARGRPAGFAASKTTKTAFF